MPWREVSVMDQRREFVMLAKQEGVNRRKLCQQFGISAPTGYKWIERYDAGDTTLADGRVDLIIVRIALRLRSSSRSWRCAMPIRLGERARFCIA